MNYCSSCGSAVARRVPSGDNRERFVCDACGTIHYQNPKIVTGCLPTYGDQVLLCRRAIQPRQGLWTLPAGFLENGETSTEGAARETKEEACANVADSYLVANEIDRGRHGQCVDEDRRRQGAGAHGQREPDCDFVHAPLATVTVD